MFRSLLSVLFACVLLGGCAADEPEGVLAADFPVLDLQEVERFLEPTFGAISGMALAEDGRLFVSDSQSLEISVFSEDGELVHTIGEEGQGPGEFLSLSDIRIIEDALYAHDIRARRTTRWALNALDQPEVVPRPEGSSHKLIGQHDGHSLWAENPITTIRSVSEADKQDRGSVSRLKESSGESDSLMAIPGTEMFILMTGDGVAFHSLDYYRETWFDFRDAVLYKHWSGDARVTLFNMEMEPVDSVAVDFGGEPLTSRQRDELANQEWPQEQTRSTYQQVLRERIPDRWPATRHFFVDENGRIWMGLNLRSEEQTRWVVFDEAHDPLGRVDLPSDVRLLAAKGDRVYGWLNDDEAGGPVPVHFALQGAVR